MKNLILISLFFTLPLYIFGQKNVKINVSIDKNYGYKFDKNGFSIGIPLEFKKDMSSVSIAFNYARKHNVTVQHKPIKIDTISGGSNCVFCWPAYYDYFYAARQFKMDYFEIPLEYKRYFNHRKEFFFKMGVYGAIVFNGKISNFEEARFGNFLGINFSNAPIYTTNSFKSLSFSHEKIKRLDAGYILGIGFTKSIVDVTCRFEESFFNLNGSNDFTLMKNTGLSIVFDVSLFTVKGKKLRILNLRNKMPM